MQASCVLRNLGAALALSAVACGSGAEDDAWGVSDDATAQRGPPGALWSTVELLREDLTRDVHPSDGGGRAWLERAQPEKVRVSTPGRYTLVYEVGPEGIAAGGAIYLQVAPFWGWSTPQVDAPEAPGYTIIEASADDIELEASTLDQQLLGIEVTGRRLEAGEQIRILYGAGAIGAFADEYAERSSHFWIAVDGDGDGARSLIANSPAIDVLAGEPARLSILLPTIARPGEVLRATVALLDPVGNAGMPVSGEVVFDEIPEGLELPQRVRLEPGDGGHKSVEGRVREPGVYRVRAVGPYGLTADSNPLVVSADGPRVLWGDLHGHSNFSDGTGTPEDYFLYARDVAALDLIALTDHDHWGMETLDTHPEKWAEIRRVTKRFHEPGRFVTLLGYEWTSWIHGHRHVLYFEDGGEIFSSILPEYETPLQLWQALEGQSALTFAHHSAGGPIPTNWDFPPDPVLEPVTEIVSVHGSSEALDSPTSIYNPVPGNFVRDALERGYRFGFIGSGDSHDGHPGLAHLASPSGGGLAAILSEERTREGVLHALRARRVYATNGSRILLRTALGVHPMGSIVTAPAESGSVTEELFVHVVAAGPMERVDLIRSGEVVDSIATEGRLDVTLQRIVEELRPGEYVYVRAVQEDGGAAWSSPIYFE